ncbi:hypothetical protein NXS19_003247 [Fusarium pseudograminearum]|nr:hypothetical protein NXS19_003247 [Fusarium pseudograminearum]
MLLRFHPSLPIHSFPCLVLFETTEANKSKTKSAKSGRAEQGGTSASPLARQVPSYSVFVFVFVLVLVFALQSANRTSTFPQTPNPPPVHGRLLKALN